MALTVKPVQGFPQLSKSPCRGKTGLMDRLIKDIPAIVEDMLGSIGRGGHPSRAPKPASRLVEAPPPRQCHVVEQAKPHRPAGIRRGDLAADQCKGIALTALITSRLRDPRPAAKRQFVVFAEVCVSGSIRTACPERAFIWLDIRGCERIQAPLAVARRVFAAGFRQRVRVEDLDDSLKRRGLRMSKAGSCSRKSGQKKTVVMCTLLARLLTPVRERTLAPTIHKLGLKWAIFSRHFGSLIILGALYFIVPNKWKYTSFTDSNNGPSVARELKRRITLKGSDIREGAFSTIRDRRGGRIRRILLISPEGQLIAKLRG